MEAPTTTVKLTASMTYRAAMTHGPAAIYGSAINRAAAKTRPIKRPADYRVPIKSMEPRARADEHSIHEIIRTPVSVRRARVRSVRVISIRAYRRRPDPHCHRPNADSHSYSHLRVRSARWNKQKNSQQRQIF
jgi:hypothetical protein